jgi:hypothetical protein
LISSASRASRHAILDGSLGKWAPLIRQFYSRLDLMRSGHSSLIGALHDAICSAAHQ